MEDLIKRDDVIKIIEEIETERLRGQINLTYAPTIKRVNDLPSADRPSGEWIELQSGFAECSECESHYFADYNFCPNCGARMKGAEDA